LAAQARAPAPHPVRHLRLLELAAFLLGELLDSEYGEMAQTQVLGKSEVACRQIVNRARRRVRTQRPRAVVNPASSRSLLSASD
jgi:RNA polymerase sigma-70 factor (ECF subfamily)